MLSVFGIPRTHEDDPVRAILAAVDIHESVSRMTGRFNGRLEKPLAMHSGIATGLVVTGKTDLWSGRQGITGDPGILVDQSGDFRRNSRWNVHHAVHVRFFLPRKMPT